MWLRSGKGKRQARETKRKARPCGKAGGFEGHECESSAVLALSVQRQPYLPANLKKKRKRNYICIYVGMIAT